LLGSSGQFSRIDGSFGATFARPEPTTLNRPAKGAGIPPKASHGVELARFERDALACSGVTGVGLLAPSISTRPARSRAPGLPLKSQVA
jgi:hypothetical protein